MRRVELVHRLGMLLGYVAVAHVFADYPPFLPSTNALSWLRQARDLVNSISIFYTPFSPSQSP